MKKISSGFTLVEALIVVSIFAIICAVALPSYVGQKRATHRYDATSALLSIVTAQEQYRSNNTSYGALGSVWQQGTSTPEGYYNLAISNTSSSGYTATATAVGDQTNDSENGTSCATLTIVVNGLSTTKTPSNCW